MPKKNPKKISSPNYLLLSESSQEERQVESHLFLSKDPESEYLIYPTILALVVFAIVLILMLAASMYPGFLPTVLIFGPELLKASLTIFLFNFCVFGFNVLFRQPFVAFTFSRKEQSENVENTDDQVREKTQLSSLNENSFKPSLIEDQKDFAGRFSYGNIHGKGPNYFSVVEDKGKNSTLYGATVEATTPTSSFSPLSPN